MQCLISALRFFLNHQDKGGVREKRNYEMEGIPMRRLALALVGLLSVSMNLLPGCGADGIATSDDVAAEEAFERVMTNPQGAESDAENDLEASNGIEALRDTYGRRCRASCRVASNSPGALCPSFVDGYGSAKQLQSCERICADAQNNAAAKAPSGCGLATCILSGC